MAHVIDGKGHQLRAGDRVVAQIEGKAQVGKITELRRTNVVVGIERAGGVKDFLVKASACSKIMVNKAKTLPKPEEQTGLQVGDRVVVRGNRRYEGLKGLIQAFNMNGALVLLRFGDGNGGCPEIEVEHLKKVQRNGEVYVPGQICIFCGGDIGATDGRHRAHPVCPAGS